MTTQIARGIKAVRLDGDDSLLLAESAGWDAVAETSVALQPTPLEAQPSAYVRKTWERRPYGQIATVGVKAAVAGGALHIRLRWLAPEPRHAITDNDVFADACGVLFPLNGKDAELSTMGDEARPVEAWHWRAGTMEPFVLTAAGLGTTSRTAAHGVTVSAAWDKSQWSVAFRRALDAPGAPLSAGTSVPMGIAVWRGSLSERAGIKSHTPDWIALELAD
ncbi:MAG TPA: ethylbenzene dehydrogenase-related protein [Tepidiformaceae bacterium]|nr:ethylbenzene dehydrogenase-related protein [Tepidiformaceae bacterium]